MNLFIFFLEPFSSAALPFQYKKDFAYNLSPVKSISPSIIFQCIGSNTTCGNKWMSIIHLFFTFSCLYIAQLLNIRASHERFRVSDWSDASRVRRRAHLRKISALRQKCLKWRRWWAGLEEHSTAVESAISWEYTSLRYTILISRKSYAVWFIALQKL
jgi:hypothetical protein